MFVGFQYYAFQYSAGQSTPPVTTTGGHYLPHKKGGKRTLSNIGIIYNSAKKLPKEEVKELIAVIEPYVEEIKDKLPEFKAVNYQAIKADNEVYKKFLHEINNIAERIEYLDKLQKEDAELLQIALICCTII